MMSSSTLIIIIIIIKILIVIIIAIILTVIKPTVMSRFAIDVIIENTNGRNSNHTTYLMMYFVFKAPVD